MPIRCTHTHSLGHTFYPNDVMCLDVEGRVGSCGIIPTHFLSSFFTKFVEEENCVSDKNLEMMCGRNDVWDIRCQAKNLLPPSPHTHTHTHTHTQFPEYNQYITCVYNLWSRHDT